MAGDEFTGLEGALHDAGELSRVVRDGAAGMARRVAVLKAIDNGAFNPDPTTRLGAYAGTRGYRRGTVGNAVHNAIGVLYIKFGPWGQERIGTVFNSARAKALFDRPVQSSASLIVATIEYEYWSDVLSDDPWSAGAQIATRFDPQTRDWLQRNVFDR